MLDFGVCRLGSQTRLLALNKSLNCLEPRLLVVSFPFFGGILWRWLENGLITEVLG
jgi:hypothetical protein